MIRSIFVPALAGLALFLFGMKAMELGLQQAAGNRLPGVLARFTRTPARGMLTATALTALLQSSTAVTVITIGLVNAGLLGFPQTLGIILGTNVGTCLTTELLGLQLGRLAPALLAASIAAFLLSVSGLPFRGRYALRDTAIAIAGFAIVLLGMDVMQSVMPALQGRGLFTWLELRSQQSDLWAVAAGAVVTALVHSSALVVALAMGLAETGALPPNVGISIIVGANVGTCATALLASVGGSRSGAHVAWAHLLLNVGGAMLAYPFIGWLDDWTAAWSSSPAAQLAHAQTAFNLGCSLLALPLCYLPVWRKGPPLRQ